MRSLSIVVASAILAAGLAGSGWLAGEALKESRAPRATVTVRGLSERDVVADLAFWPIKYSTAAATLEAAQAELDADTAAVEAFLAAAGFTADEWSVQSLQVEDRLAQYVGANPTGEVRYFLTQVLMLRSTDVAAVTAAAADIGTLVRAGVLVTSNTWEMGPFYQFTGLNALKPEMLAEATQRAREAAAQFARESGSTIGSIRDANQGVFDIAAAVAIPNENSDRQIEKRVRVVSTITYYLND